MPTYIEALMLAAGWVILPIAIFTYFNEEWVWIELLNVEMGGPGLDST